jgi:hypothetical protein
MSERPELRLVRERLESVLSPSVAGAALYEALEQVVVPPASAAATVAFVTGPLTVALTSRIGDEAQPLVDEIIRALKPALSQSGSSGQWTRQDTTLEIPLSRDAALMVLVVSASEAMATKLEGTLGTSRITAAGVRSLGGLRRALDAIAPGAIIIDATAAPQLEPADLAALISTLPRAVLRVIWGAELPFGAGCAKEIARLGGHAALLTQKEGIAPLVDLLRARTS